MLAPGRHCVSVSPNPCGMPLSPMCFAMMRRPRGVLRSCSSTSRITLPSLATTLGCESAQRRLGATGCTNRCALVGDCGLERVYLPLFRLYGDGVGLLFGFEEHRLRHPWMYTAASTTVSR